MSLSQRRRGFTLIEIMIVVCIIGLILAIALPAFNKTRAQARKQICIEQISQIESAKQQWGVENGKKDGDAPNDDDLFGSTRFMKTKPLCPGGGSYDLTVIGQNATCSQAATEGHIL